MSRIYYVVGYQDTRQEFSPRGITTSKAKAEKFKEKLAKALYPNAREWASIKEVKGIT